MQTPPPPPPPPADLPPPPPPPGGMPPPLPPVAPYPAYAAVPAYAPPVYSPAPPANPFVSDVQFAGFWVRAVAAFLDGLLVGIVIRLVFLVINLITIGAAIGTGTQSLDTSSSGVVVLVYLVYFAFYAGYYIYFWGMGQTPAQCLFHIYVADAHTGTAIGFSRAGLRFLGYVLSSLVCYVGLIWAAFDPHKQGWHDKIANTVVFYGGG